MIKKLILYTRGIETLWFFSERLGDAFKKMGYEIFYFDLGAEYDSFLRLLEFIEPGVTASVSFNFNGCSGEEFFYDKNGVHLYDFKDVPTINIVVDHPLYYHKFVPYLPEKYTQVSIDLEHEEYLKRFFPDIKRGPFIPLAGTNLYPDKPLPGWDDREMDVAFVGHYNPPEKQEEVFKRNGPEYDEFYHGIIDDLIAHPWQELSSTLEKHISESFADELTEESLKDTLPYMIVIDLYIRHYYRGEVIKKAVDSGVRVDVFGSGWEQLKCDHPENLIIHKQMDSRTCLEKLRHAKVSLNIMPWFKRGAHDRVFNSMLNGSICVTDPSQYLASELGNEKEVMFYRLEELDKLPDIVRVILSDKKLFADMQERAYEVASAHHTWEKRAERIDKEILKYG